MTAAVYGITIEQYADFNRSFQITDAGEPVDLTGYQFAAQVRERSQSTDSVPFTVVITDAATGVINISMSDAVTATLDPGDQVYDVVMTTNSGTDIRLLQGVATITAGVTR